MGNSLIPDIAVSTARLIHELYEGRFANENYSAVNDTCKGCRSLVDDVEEIPVVVNENFDIEEKVGSHHYKHPDLKTGKPKVVYTVLGEDELKDIARAEFKDDIIKPLFIHLEHQFADIEGTPVFLATATGIYFRNTNLEGKVKR